MRIIDRYIGLAVINGTFLVLAILLSLFTFATFVNEMDMVGKAQYGIGQAAAYVLLSLPSLVYQIFPLSALIGSMIGLGAMASSSELVVMRAAGVSVGRVSWSVMRAGLLLMLVAIAIGEFVAPVTDAYAHKTRTEALNKQVSLGAENGFWTRDGDKFVHVGAVFSDHQLRDIRIYDFDAKHILRAIIDADNAFYNGENWTLYGVVQRDITDHSIIRSEMDKLAWQSYLTPGMLEIVEVKPSSLSMVELYVSIQYLKNNGLSARRQEMAFWSKLVLPFSTGVMVFLSIPFVFGSLRSVSVGQRVMVGTLLGIGFYLMNQILNNAGFVYQFNPITSAVFPTLLFFFIAVFLMRRTR